jgi:hypothetical protein
MNFVFEYETRYIDQIPETKKQRNVEVCWCVLMCQVVRMSGSSSKALAPNLGPELPTVSSFSTFNPCNFGVRYCFKSGHDGFLLCPVILAIL